MNKVLSRSALKIFLFSLPIFLGLFFYFSHLLFAATSSTDAIAIRVMQNPKHLSPVAWYAEQKFTGSPQSLLVDGYEAIRDGRTVYVAAANIIDQGSLGVLDKNDQLYTNIYIISFNNDAEQPTQDIFGQILAHWKFNTNLTVPGKCQKAATSTCSYSADCLSPDYCKGSKATVIRDVKRLADLNNLNGIVAKYQLSHDGLCPKLESGSYLPNKSISTWPSWQQTLGAALGTVLPVDPINQLGKCKTDPVENSKYEPTTCWSELDKKFAATSSPVFNLPDSSLAYLYISSPDGKTCSFFAPTESGLVCDSTGLCKVNNNISDPFTFGVAPGNLGSVTNHAPVITCGSMVGYSKKVFSGYVSAADPDGDALKNWSIDTSDPINNGWPNWVGGPILKSTAVLNQRQVYADKVGDFTTTKLNTKITVQDLRGSSTTITCPMTIAGYCGDGVTQSNNHEDCDDGNSNAGDACDNNCKWTIKTTGAINLSGAYADALVFDNSNLVNTSTDVPGGTYLKINGIQKTPYLWVALVGEAKVAKIRTFTGKKRNCVRNGTSIECSWDGSVPDETIGQVIGTYDTFGLTPSRTAVNVETGDVWVHNRYQQTVTKLDINGNKMKVCKTDPAFSDSMATVGTSGNGGGLAIAKNGDIWAGNYYTGKVVRISGDDSDCTILQTVIVGGAPYGLAIDSDGNVWVKGGALGLVRINNNTTPATIDNFTAGFYGMTVDTNDNVWLSSLYSANSGVQRINKGSPAGTLPTAFGITAPGQTTGMTVDSNGDIWASGYTTNTEQKFLKDGTFVFSKPSGGSNPHGSCGDSEGHVWSVNIGGGLVRGFNLDGSIAADVCPIGEASPGVCNGTTMYTYSDMTGLNRAAVLRSGVWKLDPPLDAGFDNQHWGNIYYDKVIKPGSDTSAEVYIRASNDPLFTSTSFVLDNSSTTPAWNSKPSTDPMHQGRYLQVKVILRSSDRGVTPVISNIRISPAL